MARFFDTLILYDAKSPEEILCRVFLALSLGFSIGMEPGLQISKTQEFLDLLETIQEEDKDV